MASSNVPIRYVPHPLSPIPTILSALYSLYPLPRIDLNIILSQTYEYRLPLPPKFPSASSTTLDMTSRFVGLVVVPGPYITRIEVEEFESQMKGVGKGSKMVGEGLKTKSTSTSEEPAFCAGGVCEPDNV